MAGVQESFGKAADRTLPKLAGLRLCESTVERTTEEAGARLGARLAEGAVFGLKAAWEWNRDATGRTCAYVSLDATGILMQGPDGAKADGRMVTVGMIYNPRPRAADDEALSRPCDGARYLAGLYSLEELGLQMRWQGAQVGMDAAEQWIALSDAGNGLEGFIDVNFPRAEKILDFQHGATHLAAFAKPFRPDTSEKLLAAWCHTLKHAGGAVMIRVLERLDRKKMAEEVRSGHDGLLNYLRKNVDRMDYPRYLRNGWQIGSGAVESACKTVVNQRLCLGGMRWGEGGSDAVAHLAGVVPQRPGPVGRLLGLRHGRLSEKSTYKCHAYPAPGNGLARASKVRRAHVEVSSPRTAASRSRIARSASVRRMRRMFSLTSPSGFFGLPMR